MAFERYVRTGRTVRPMVSLWPRGQMHVNTGAIKRFKLADYPYVVLFFDAETNRVGMCFTKDWKEVGAQKVTHNKQGLVISAKAFLEEYAIWRHATKRYPLEEFVQIGLYVFAPTMLEKETPCLVPA